jgi:hypothetical protein
MFSEKELSVTLYQFANPAILNPRLLVKLAVIPTLLRNPTGKPGACSLGTILGGGIGSTISLLRRAMVLLLSTPSSPRTSTMSSPDPSLTRNIASFSVK